MILAWLVMISSKASSDTSYQVLQLTMMSRELFSAAGTSTKTVRTRTEPCETDQHREPDRAPLYLLDTRREVAVVLSHSWNCIECRKKFWGDLVPVLGLCCLRMTLRQI